jgi:hypothetical protein
LSEPSLMIALLPMEQDAFRALMRGPLGDAFADAIARILINGLEDRIVLRWLKAEQAAFIAVIHRWEDRPDEVMQRAYFTELKTVPAALRAKSRGRLLFSPGAMNFLEDGVEAGFVFTSTGLEPADAATPEEMKTFDALLNSYVFKGDWHEHPYHDAIRLPAVVDKLVAANVARRLEEHRVETARDRLPRATFAEPVRLFEGYHSTGRMLLSRGTQRLSLLDRIDPVSVRQTSYGAADTQRIVVRGRVLDADPQAFKVHRIGADAAFYTDGQSVYWPDATPIDGVDAKRFKLVKPCFGFDGQRWYTYDKRVLADVGDDATVDASLYFWYLTLLLGSRGVYLGSSRLPVDPRSVAVRRIEKRPTGPTAGVYVIWLSDHVGDFVISGHSSDGLFAQRKPRMMRVTDGQAAFEDAFRNIAHPRPAYIERVERLGALKPAQGANETAHCAFLDAAAKWIVDDYPAVLQERPEHHEMWTLLETGLGLAIEQKDTPWIERFVERVGPDAWLYAPIFHRLAKHHATSGNGDRAFDAAWAALEFGQNKSIDDLLADPTLASYQDLDHWKALRTQRANLNPFRPPLASGLLQRFTGSFHHLAVRTALDRFSVPSSSALNGKDPYIADYRAAFVRFMDRFAQHVIESGDTQDYHFGKLFLTAGDVEGLRADALLLGAICVYSEGLSWNDMQGTDTEPRAEFALAARALARCRTAPRGPAWDRLVVTPLARAFQEHPV